MVKWMRDDVLLREAIIQGKNRAVLRINASIENSGQYRCVANNGIGEVV